LTTEGNRGLKSPNIRNGLDLTVQPRAFAIIHGVLTTIPFGADLKRLQSQRRSKENTLARALAKEEGSIAYPGSFFVQHSPPLTMSVSSDRQTTFGVPGTY
jgi:hypothetical protein